MDSPPETDPPAAPAAPPAPRHRWRLIASIVGGLATAASLVIGFIAIVPILTQNSSGTDKLVVTVVPYRPTELELYVVPLDADLTGFPTAAGADCTAEQRSWLAAAGERYQGYYLVTVRNAATSGNVIGVGDFVGAGSSSAPEAASVIVQCDVAATGQPSIAPGRLPLSSGTSAYYDRSRLAGDSTPDTPVIYNLLPGESGQFPLLLVSRDSFSGNVSYSITSGADRAEGVLDFGTALSVPGTAPANPMIVTTDSEFWQCVLTAAATECAAR